MMLAALGACRPVDGSTETPGDGDTSTLENIEDAPPTAGTPDAPAAAAGADKSKPLPKVRDRDPEEEKKKLALSHQRSAEAAKHLASGRLVEAIDHSRQALKIHEQNVEAMLVMAEAYYRQKKFELVQAVTSSALAVDEKVRTGPETSRAHNLKGFAYTQMGQDNLATQAFRLAAEADEKNASAWNNLGTRYMQAGDVATAKQCFGYALELDPKFAKAHVNLGAALRADGKVQDAEKSLQTALKLKPNYPEAYFNLGVLYLDADPYPGLETVARLEKAISFLTKYRDLAIADGPEGPSGKKGPKVAPGPAAVSQARADDYIRVAKKGIDREQRRLEREKTRDTKPTEAKPKPPAAADAGAEDGEPTTADAPGEGTEPTTPSEPGASDPAKPLTPKKPGGATPSPSTPTPSTPTPSTPSPNTPTPVAKPGGTPPPAAKPSSPATPTQPSEPTPPAAKPSAPESKPSTPVAKPSTPPAAPSSPPSGGSPSAPPSAPVVKPATPPASPAPQKPAVQKPGAPKSARLRVEHPRMMASVNDPIHQAGNPRRCVDTHALARASRTEVSA
jgi:Flp pilus assembly protein TadD